jgi:hypothetical protein
MPFLTNPWFFFGELQSTYTQRKLRAFVFIEEVEERWPVKFAVFAFIEELLY